MKLAEALRIIQNAPAGLPSFPVGLITGNTPEPLSYFLAAHLQTALPERRVQVNAGIFGDLAGNLAKHLESGEGPGVCLLEWADLDARLGYRESGAWGRTAALDIVDSVRLRLKGLAQILESHPSGTSLFLVPPALPLSPVVPVPRWQMSSIELALRGLVAEFLTNTAAFPRVRVLSSGNWADVPPRDRIDLKSWWMSGFPYQRRFASRMAEEFARAISAPPRCKGVITDLDNTLWSGILGDVGVAGVHWSLEHHAAQYGVYQRFLRSLAEDGVLVGVASKNDRAMVEEVLKRPDILIPPDLLFPIEAHWQPKSGSVERILKAWNIGPESVVFVDDSPLEIALMQAAYPRMDCRLFPAEDPQEFAILLEDLSNLFGQNQRSEEDALRLSSLRGSAERELAPGETEDELLKSSGAELTIVKVVIPPDPRALELINKTNQFNLNGARYTEADWLKYLRSGRAWMVSYRDKFGALGKIAVLAGRVSGRRLDVDSWVLSCRAFSRRIEHSILEFLFEQENIEEIVLHFSKTPRNTPLCEFLQSLGNADLDPGEIHVTPASFALAKPPLYASVMSATEV